MVAFLMQKRFGEPRPDDLIFAVTKGNANMTRMLLEDGRVDPKAAVREAVLSLDAALIRLFLGDERAEKYINSFLFPSSVLGLKETPPSPSDIASKSLPVIEAFIRYHEKVSLHVLLSWLKPALQYNKDGLVRLLQTSPNFDLNAKFFEAVKTGNTYLVDQLVRLSLVNPAAHDNEAIHVAACGFNDHILRDLLKTGMVNPGDRDGVFVAILLDSGNIQALTLMLNHPDCNPSVNSNFALRLAIRKKDIALVKKILCYSRKRKIDVNIPIYGASTPLMEAVKSCNEEIVSHLLTFPKFAPSQTDVERALALARNMNNDVMITMLQRLNCAGRVCLDHPDNAWSFSVDPARVLVWLKASIKEMHEHFCSKSVLQYTVVKPVHEMIEDIFAGRPANQDPFKRVVGFEPLKLAYEDFMQSRPEMTEAWKKDLLVRIMLTDFVPEFIVYDQPDLPPPTVAVAPSSRKRAEHEVQSSDSSQPRHSEVSCPAPKKRRTQKPQINESVSVDQRMVMDQGNDYGENETSGESPPSTPKTKRRQARHSRSRSLSLNLKRTRLQEKVHQQQQQSGSADANIVSPTQPTEQVPADKRRRIIIRFVVRTPADVPAVPRPIDVVRIDEEPEVISTASENDHCINPLFSSLLEVAKNALSALNEK
jgi:hypothetical protein